MKDHDQDSKLGARCGEAETGAVVQQTASLADGALMAEMPNGLLISPRKDNETAPADDLPEPWERAAPADLGAAQQDSVESAEAEGSARSRGGETPEVYDERLRKNQLTVVRMMPRLYRCSEEDPTEALDLTYHILRSSALKHVSAHETQVRRVKKKNLDIAKVRAIQEEMDFSRPCDEPARLFFLRKPSGGERPIVAFGGLEHALQDAAQQVLVVNTSRWNTQFDGVSDALDFIGVAVSTWR